MSDSHPRARLALSAFLVLFLELSLIRWAGAQVVYLSFFTNFILLGSFLGIGIGFLRAKSKRDLFAWAPLALGVLALVVHMVATRVPESGLRLRYFEGSPGDLGLPPWIALPVIFLAVAAVMALASQGLARAFAPFKPLDAYRLDILGSLGGVIAVAGLAFLEARPVVWGSVVAGLFILLGRRRWPLVVAGCAVFLGVLFVQSTADDTYYSPYYRIEVRPPDSVGAIEVLLNATPHQFIASTELLKVHTPTYFNAYPEEAPVRERVLIIGAGTGNDVAIALRQGAKRVDAVEVDPTLVRIGEALHPDHPYQDERVRAVVDDGRAFLERTQESYDQIVYALPDSTTMVTGQAGLRLESYLFTEQALQAAKDHLADGGTFAFYGYFPAPWMEDRMASLIADVFGATPCFPDGLPLASADPAPRLSMITVGPGSCAYPWEPRGEVLSPPTDDRPFPYLRGSEVPSFYWYALGLIFLVSLGAVRLAGGPLRQMRPYLDLFFMGAAFLLLETKSVVQFALLFGTTWFVNALVFAGVLLVVLAGVEVARRVRLKRPALLYPFLFLSLFAAWMVPPDLLLDLPVVPRFVVAVVLAFTPVFLANLIFSQRFRGVEASTVAFASNLLGAMVGGLLEYSALVIGYRSLIVVAAVLYLLAFVAGRHHLLRAS